MSNKVLIYNNIQSSLRKFYEEDFVILVNHLLSNNIMTMSELARLLGVSRQTIIARVDRYRMEQEEEEEEQEDNDPGDTDDNSYEEARDSYDLSIEYENNLYNSMEN